MNFDFVELRLRSLAQAFSIFNSQFLIFNFNYPTIAKMSLWRMMRYLVPSSSSSVPAYLP